jgi:RNA recognition motif-containing protein
MKKCENMPTYKCRDKKSRTILVSHLPADINESILTNHFSQASIIMLLDKSILTNLI